jgi:CRP/FNR family transcriptional regulator
MNRKIHHELQVSCGNCSLNEICIPRGLSAEEIRGLSEVVQQKKVLHKGDFLYRQGDEFRGILAVQSGSAKLLTDDETGNEHILSILLPGELLGFDGLTGRHSCSAAALNTLSFCEIPSNQIDVICQKVPSLIRELFRHTNDTLNCSKDRVVINKRAGEVRLAIFLIDLSERLKVRGFSSTDFILPLTREEIGNHLGLALETISRLLKQFQNQQLITVKQKQVKILNLNGLKNIQKESHSNR